MWQVLLGLFLSFEVANFTGFSWTHMRRLSEEELINAAIRFKYPRIYANIEELRADYSKFRPDVLYWKSLTDDQPNQFWEKFVGNKLFNIRLPDAVVIVNADGQPLFSRRCSENSWCSPTIAPDKPLLGIVGTVQEGPPHYYAAAEVAARWIDDPNGTAFVSGHCFAAFSQSEKPTLRIISSSGNPVEISDRYGYFLVAITDLNKVTYGSVRISEVEFRRSQTCDTAVRAAWPNVGGWVWKR